MSISQRATSIMNPTKDRLYIGKVVSITLWANDVTVKRTGLAKPPKNGRSELTMLSAKSRKRLAFVARNTAVQFIHMITLTYPSEFPTDGRLTKKHLNAFLTWARRAWPGLNYLWFLEFQKRGAPHIHILTDQPARLTKDAKQLVSRRWYEIVKSGDEKHLLAGTNCEKLRTSDGGARYVTKYAYKTEQKFVPKNYSNVGRFWGHSRDVAPLPGKSIELDNDQLQALLDDTDWARKGDAVRGVWGILFGQSENLAAVIDKIHGKG